MEQGSGGGGGARFGRLDVLELAVGGAAHDGDNPKPRPLPLQFNGEHSFRFHRATEPAAARMHAHASMVDRHGLAPFGVQEFTFLV